MTLRDATLDDASAIAAVLIDSMRSTYRGLLPDEVLDNLSYETRAAAVRAKLGDPGDDLILVALDGDGTIFGYISGGPERTRDGEFAAEVLDIYLLESGQGQGHGRALMIACVERFLERGLSSMLVWVFADNPGRLFYESLGGTAVREKKLVVGGRELLAIGYGWRDLQALLQDERRRAGSKRRTVT
ncbi:MAG: GNAT family N-acetyltransferase [Trueperaceae bacterium]|nr:GNAT family N-acetyltransferase [Trueperaceae bacterium]